MRHLTLPAWLRKRVLAYYEMMHDVECSTGDGEADAFMDELSPALQADIRLCLFESLLVKAPFFSNPDVSSNMVEDMVMAMKSRLYLPGDTITRKGEKGDWCVRVRECRVLAVSGARVVVLACV